MQDVQASSEGTFWGRREDRVGIAEEHEDVPDAELGGEWDGVIEKGEVPAGAVGGWFDA